MSSSLVVVFDLETRHRGAIGGQAKGFIPIEQLATLEQPHIDISKHLEFKIAF